MKERYVINRDAIVEKYQGNKKDIAEKYQGNKNIIAEQYRGKIGTPIHKKKLGERKRLYSEIQGTSKHAIILARKQLKYSEVNKSKNVY